MIGTTCVPSAYVNLLSLLEIPRKTNRVWPRFEEPCQRQNEAKLVLSARVKAVSGRSIACPVWGRLFQHSLAERATLHREQIAIMGFDFLPPKTCSSRGGGGSVIAPLFRNMQCKPAHLRHVMLRIHIDNIVAYLPKARIVKPAEIAVARERLCKQTHCWAMAE
jgi:hypothetical protein